MGDAARWSPIIHKGQHALTLRHRSGTKRRAEAPKRGSSDPMIVAGGPRTGELLDACERARPTGRSHGRTTYDPAQRLGGAKRRPRERGCTERRAAKGVGRAEIP